MVSQSLSVPKTDLTNGLEVVRVQVDNVAGRCKGGEAQQSSRDCLCKPHLDVCARMSDLAKLRSTADRVSSCSSTSQRRHAGLHSVPCLLPRLRTIQHSLYLLFVQQGRSVQWSGAENSACTLLRRLETTAYPRSMMRSVTPRAPTLLCAPPLASHISGKLDSATRRFSIPY